MRIRTYKELMRISDFYERFEYLRLSGEVGAETFGWERYLNQHFYRTAKWRKTRDEIIIRDEGCDLAHPDFGIYGPITIHHLNPITAEDIENDRDILYDPNLLVCTSSGSHRAIHYGDRRLLPELPIERRPGDTCPWK